ncbi:hypothetical protein [Nocardioides sp.]|uniref:hypothetical protein n=1 Tax=Nocardioides sp. TaxID=35761 RepID=UPI0026186BEF|nr:hypothetical protein [Nocardioides sp.]
MPRNAPVHLFRLVLAAALAVAGLAFAPIPAAQAAVTSGPTAVAVGPDGTTYVGTAAGGSLARFDASGAALSPLSLPRSGPVDGLYVMPSGPEAGTVWVSYGFAASQLSPAGDELVFFTAGGSDPSSCASSDADDPGRYGDIYADSDSVILVHRCRVGLSVYSRTDYQQRFGANPFPCTVSDCRYGAIAKTTLSRPGALNGAFYLSVPNQSQVEVWTGFSTHASPSIVIDVQAHGGGVTPRPTGVAVDDQGTLFVTDIANHVIYVYVLKDLGSGQYGYEYNRYIGSPPDADADGSGFDGPVSISQYPRNGSIGELQGNLFIADSGNNRIVRRDTYSYTFWDADLDGSGGGGPSSPPYTISTPTVTGTPAVGQTLTCSPGQYAGAPTQVDVGWNRDNSYIPGEGSSTYVVKSGDAGRKISCFERPRNSVGYGDYATSANVTIQSGPPANAAPVNTIRPTVSGTPQPGRSLVCGNGQWTGTPAPTYAQQWLRNGTAIDGATTSSYQVTDADLGAQLVCRVTATNSQGASTAQSTPVSVTATPPAPSCTGPVGVSINSAAVATNDASVSLRIRPPAGATQVVISNDGGFDTAQVRSTAGDCTYPWTLSSTGFRDTRVVYVRFVGGGVDEIVTLSDDIVLDTAAPSVNRQVIKKLKKSQGFKVKVTAKDSVSGVSKVRFSNKKGARGTSTVVANNGKAYRDTIRTKKAGKYRWVKVYDRAGNSTGWEKSARR